jgi:putative ABC transport system permease protein
MPDWKEPVRDRLRGLNLAPAREAEIVEELADHLDQRYRELLAGGIAHDEADRMAMEELESRELLAGRLRQTRLPAAREPLAIGTETRSRGNFMESLWHDWKVAFRMLRNKPAFSLAVAGMLALGVAGNAAIFSIFNGLFLRPLPFAEPARLVDLDETAPKWNLTRVGISNPDYDAWQKGNATFDGMAFFSAGGANLSTADGAAQRIKTASVTKDLLSVLGLKPVIGRDILPEEDRPGGNRVILLGYDLWQRLFHGDRGVVGRALKLSERPYTVIGVLPREAVVPPDVEAWMPLGADVTKGGSFYLGGVGRLKHGVSMEQAAADLLRVHRSDKQNDVTSPTVGPLRDRYLGDYKVVTRILLGAVALVLLIACVNIAGLMLVRGEARSREIAIRTAVGASRARVIRQLLTESFVLAATGGVMGVALGKIFLLGLVSLMPDDLPKWVRFDLDVRFVLFCVAVTGAAAVLFGLAPALQAATVDTRSWLQEAARSTLTRGKRAVLSVLVVGEIALALVLLASSGLLLQAFRKVMHEDPGFRPENVLTFTLRLAPAKFAQPEQQFAFYSGLVDRLRALPGVAAVSAASIVPLDGHTGYFFVAEGREVDQRDQNPVVLQVMALPGYFDAMGMTLKAGRTFEQRDNQRTAPKVAIVNETFAKHFWGTPDVVGKRIKYPGGNDWFQVVGLVRDIRHYGLDSEIRPQVFVSFPVAPANGMTLAIRSFPTSGNAAHNVVGPAREAVRQMDPDLPMYNIRTMAERLDRSLWVRRAYSWLFVAFAAVAMLLAAAGVYGVISFAVSQRTREIGIRMALGARPGQVMRGILGQGMVLVSVGVALGLIASQLTAGLLKSMLFGVSTRDVATYFVVVLGVALVGLAANYVPARRAAGIEPVRALRAE